MSTANAIDKLQPHIRRQHQENRVHLIWSIWTSVARCHISLLAAPPTLSTSLTIRLVRCGHSQPEPNIGCSRSFPNSSPWWRTSVARCWFNAYGLTMEESWKVKNSLDFVGNAAFNMNTWHHVVWSKTKLSNEWIGQFKNESLLCFNTMDYQMAFR